MYARSSFDRSRARRRTPHHQPAPTLRRSPVRRGMMPMPKRQRPRRRGLRGRPRSPLALCDLSRSKPQHQLRHPAPPGLRRPQRPSGRRRQLVPQSRSPTHRPRPRSAPRSCKGCWSARLWASDSLPPSRRCHGGRHHRRHPSNESGPRSDSRSNNFERRIAIATWKR